MTYVITEPCVGCKDESCMDVCPVFCIHDAGDQVVIDPKECVECEACVSVCPVEAIFHENDVPPEWAHYKTLNATFFSAGGA